MESNQTRTSFAHATHKAKDSAHEFKDAAVQTGSDLKDAAVHAASDLKDAAVQKGSDFKDAAYQKAGEIADAAMRKGSEYKDAVVRKGTELKNSAVKATADTYEKCRSNTDAYVQANPYRTALIAFSIGALVGVFTAVSASRCSRDA